MMRKQNRILILAILGTLAMLGGGGLLLGAAARPATLAPGAARAVPPAAPHGAFTPTATPSGCSSLPVWQPGPPHPPAREYIQGAVGSDGKFYTAGGWVAGTPAVTNDASR